MVTRPLAMHVKTLPSEYLQTITINLLIWVTRTRVPLIDMATFPVLNTLRDLESGNFL